MMIIGRKELDKFKKKHSESRKQVDSWEAEVKGADWETSVNVKERYPKASIVGDRNVIFDFCWNKYRLWVQVSYKTKIVVVKKIGTHKEYETWVII